MKKAIDLLTFFQIVILGIQIIIWPILTVMKVIDNSWGLGMLSVFILIDYLVLIFMIKLPFSIIEKVKKGNRQKTAITLLILNLIFLFEPISFLTQILILIEDSRKKIKAPTQLVEENQ